MNILYTLYSCVRPNVGGVEQVTFLITQYLSSHGHKVHYLYPSSLKDRKVDEDNNLGNNVHFLPNKNILSSENLLFLNQLIEYNNIHIAILQATCFTDYAKLFKAIVGIIPIVNNYHMYPMSMWELFLYNRGRTNSTKEKRVTNLKEVTKRMLPDLYNLRITFKMHYTLREVSNYATKNVLLSSRLEKLYRKRYHVKNKKSITTIANPLTFEPLPLSKYKDKENILLYVGRFEHQTKRIDRIIKTWSFLEETFTEWKLVLVGGNEEVIGEREEKIRMKQLVGTLKLSRVEFVSPCNPLMYYQKSKIFCMTSTKEGFGMTLVEAMSQGCVPVAFGSFPTVYDIIDDSKNGVIVKPFDLKAYAGAIAELMSDSEKLKIFGISAIEKSKSYNINAIGQKTEYLYQTLIDEF